MPTPPDPHALGRWGERVAARLLEGRGWRVLARNYRWRHKEVDLVVRRGRVVAFVEVKTRAGSGFGSPLEAITPRKRREVEAAARHFLREEAPPGVLARFDAVGVVRRGGGLPPLVEHVEDAWRPGWP